MSSSAPGSLRDLKVGPRRAWFPTWPGGHPFWARVSRRRSSIRRPAAVRGLLVFALVTLGSLVRAPAASAHDELLDVQPGNKVTVSIPPTEVQMVFSAAVLALGTRIRVTGPTDTVVSTGPVSVNGGTVVQKLRGGLSDGVYKVDWRVTASDGHPVSGTYTWTLKATGPATATARAPATSTATAPATSTSTSTATAPATSTSTGPAPASAPSASPVPSVSGGRGGAGTPGSGPSTGLVVGLSVLAAAMAGTAFVLVRHRDGVAVNIEGNQKK